MILTVWPQLPQRRASGDLSSLILANHPKPDPSSFVQRKLPGERYKYYLNTYQIIIFNHKSTKMGQTHHHYHTTEREVPGRPAQTIIKYETPPDVLKRLKELQEEKKDPKKVVEVSIKMKKLICHSLSKHQFPTKFPEKRVVFLGRTSTGKSSLINHLFQTKFKVAAGRCTTQISEPFQLNGVNIYDVPGFDNKFNLTLDYELMVSKLGQINVAYILFESVTDIEDLVAVLLSMKRQVYFIRTKCDNIDKDCELTLEQEIQRDIGELKKISVLDPVVFATSKKGGFDNQKLTLHILS